LSECHCVRALRKIFDSFAVPAAAPGINDSAPSAWGHWIRVGVAFPHADGKVLQIELKALPTNGKLIVRLHKAKAE
jgi:hypothetical protein